MRRINSRFGNAGFALPGVVLIMVLLAILVPAFILLTQKDSKDAVADTKKSIALQLAEAAQDRGAWKLRESGAVWTAASSGTVIAGYNNDVEYVDNLGGIYKILFSSGPLLGQVTILSKGKAAGSDVVRAIQGIYSKEGAQPLSAVTVNSALTWKPNMTVHWGPVITYGSITSSPGTYFPRKYSAGQIVGRDTVNDSNNGAMPGNNWSTYDYVAFYDLGVPPTINLDTYRTRAKAETGIPAMGGATQSPAGSGYFTPTSSQGLDIEKTSNPKAYIINNSSCVLFVEGSVKKFPSAAQLNVEALIVTGDTDFNADSLNVTANIPCTASQEYQHTSLGNYFTAHGWTDCGTAALTGIGLKGFLYVGGDMNNAGGGATLVGAIFIVGSMNVNTFTVYYDSSVAAKIETGGSGQVYRSSWDQIATSW